MSTSAIIFSKNRAAQLDLLLNSIRRNVIAFDDISVLWAATDEDYKKGYLECEAEHPKVSFRRQKTYEFEKQVHALLRKAGDHVAFLCDDDVFYRPFYETEPGEILTEHPDVLCVSYRLGLNTTFCYPMNAEQTVPKMAPHKGIYFWQWKGKEFDWGYPGSLDGHVFRRSHLHALISTGSFSAPNQLEDLLSMACRDAVIPRMACYKESVLVGIPVNIVNTTHRNRHGEVFGRDTKDLNDRYLKGARLRPRRMKFENINAAHQEVRLAF
jgi:hypothetical protein